MALVLKEGSKPKVSLDSFFYVRTNNGLLPFTQVCWRKYWWSNRVPVIFLPVPYSPFMKYEGICSECRPLILGLEKFIFGFNPQNLPLLELACNVGKPSVVYGWF